MIDLETIDFRFENLNFEVKSKNPQGLVRDKLLKMIMENSILIWKPSFWFWKSQLWFANLDFDLGTIDFGFENLDFEVQSKNPQGLDREKLLKMMLQI